MIPVIVLVRAEFEEFSSLSERKGKERKGKERRRRRKG